MEVKDKKTIKLFLDFPSELYKTDKNWVRYLDKEIEKVFDPNKNKSFRNGDAIRWVLLQEKKTIGRIAAFYNSGNSAKEDQPTGGIGFFDCIDNQDAANLLFDKSKLWMAP